MPRLRTDAAERTAQNHKLRDEVATELGDDALTLKAAVEHRRNTRGPAGVADIVARPLPLSDDQVEPIGVILGKIGDMKVTPGGMAQLVLSTNSREFGLVLMDAVERSRHEILAVAVYAIPRNLGIEDGDEAEGMEG